MTVWQIANGVTVESIAHAMFVRSDEGRRMVADLLSMDADSALRFLRAYQAREDWGVLAPDSDFPPACREVEAIRTLAEGTAVRLGLPQEEFVPAVEYIAVAAVDGSLPAMLGLDPNLPEDRINEIVALWERTVRPLDN